MKFNCVSRHFCDGIYEASYEGNAIRNSKISGPARKGGAHDLRTRVGRKFFNAVD